ncbi:hypothetical protein EDD11_008083 [Mortierella claussenii]|nr:hypothetical protein EDD11_008083 [Mortierella claussenii]
MLTEPTSAAVPYPETETEYQDYDPAPQSRRSSSFYSFISSVSSTNTASLRSKTSSIHSKKNIVNGSSGPSSSCSLPNDSKQAIRLQRTPTGLSRNSDGQYDHESLQDYQYDTTIKPPPQRPFYRRKKFWWICLIMTIIFLAGFIPLLLIVIIPKVAQVIMDGSTMGILQMNMTNPQERSVEVSVEAAIGGIPSLFGAIIDFQGPLEVNWVRGTESIGLDVGGDGGSQADAQPRVGQMSLDTIVKKAFAKAEFRQATVFEIADPQLFGEFAKTMVRVAIKDKRILLLPFNMYYCGRINVVVLGRTIKNLNLDKFLTLDGLSNFAGLKILSFDIPSDAPNGAGALVAIKVSIPNVSPIGMSLGTLDIDMRLETAYLGRITAKNVVLVGGQPTILSLEGTINKQTDSVSLQELSDMITHYLANTATTAYGQGVSVLPDGVNAVSWITEAIVATKMSIPLLPPSPINVIKDIKIQDLNLWMTQEQPWAPSAASTGIAASFQLPFNMSLNITDIWNPLLILGYHNSAMADITTALWNRSNSDMAHNNISFTLPRSPMYIRDNAHGAFTDFLMTVTQQDTAVIEILGSAQSVASTSLGLVNITVPFNTTLTVPGIHFSTMEPQIGGITIVGATVDYVVLNATVIIQNPSIFSVDAGPTTLQINATVHGKMAYIGEVMLTNLRLNPGANPLQAIIHFRPSDTQFRDEFFTEYIVGTSFDAFIYGDAQSSSVASLSPLMQSLKMSTTVPGMNPAPKLVIGGNGNTTVGQFLNNHQIMLQVQILNPLATTLWIHQFMANVTWNQFSLGNIQVDQSFSIKPSGVDTSPLFGVQIPSSYQFWVFMISTFLPANLGVLSKTGAMVKVDLRAKIKATLDGTMGQGYLAGIEYGQDQVEVFLRIEFSLAGIGVGQRRMNKRSEKMETEMLANLGPEPDMRDGTAYLAWLKRAIDLSFPEEVAATAAEHGGSRTL